MNGEGFAFFHYIIGVMLRHPGEGWGCWVCQAKWLHDRGGPVVRPRMGKGANDV